MAKKIIGLFVGVLMILMIFAFGNYAQPKLENVFKQANQQVDQQNQTKYLVKAVIDGDTIKINDNGEDKSVRLVGIDSPELNDDRELVKCFARMSKQKLQEKILNKQVVLINEPGQNDKDVYGRLLRYVYLENEDINGWLIKEGYVFAYTKYPISRTNEFLEFQQEARNKKVGLWGDKCSF